MRPLAAALARPRRRWRSRPAAAAAAFPTSQQRPRLRFRLAVPSAAAAPPPRRCLLAPRRRPPLPPAAAASLSSSSSFSSSQESEHIASCVSVNTAYSVEPAAVQRETLGTHEVGWWPPRASTAPSAAFRDPGGENIHTALANLRLHTKNVFSNMLNAGVDLGSAST